MKRMCKKLLAILLTAVMILGVFPATAFALGDGSAQADEPVVIPNGNIPFYHVGTTAVTDAYLRGEKLEVNGVTLTEPSRDTLPSSYNSNTLGYVTSVKNQNPYGSCWAHAAMGSIESYMIKHGIKVGTGAAATTSLNLSETQHCYFNYSTAYDAEGMLTGDKCTLTGSDSCLDSGGNGEMSAYTLQRWCGAADESQSALQYSKASTVASSGLGSQYSYNYNVCHVQNSEWIPASNIEAVKRAIMEYGAGNISYYESGNAYTYICTIDTSSQSSSSHKWANHAITIVGWDDSIATSNFKPNKPSGKGAWICKNSWGTSYFSSGYCYISYEDTSVLEGYIYFYDAESIDNYDHNYQYDGSCNPVCYGKGWPSGEDYYVGFENDTKVANVFTAKGSEVLKAVALCNWDEALTYTVEIYKNPTAGNPSSGTLMTTQTGTLTYSGYYTIPLDNPVSLAAGDTFSVVFTQNVPEADDNGKYVHTPYDATFSNTDVVSWANWTHTNHGNTSYYKEPSGSWTDCPDNGDYRIKAYTDDVTFTLTAVSNNTNYGTVSVNGTVITASPKTGYYVESCDVISGTASCTINGNTISVSASSDCTIRVNFAPKPTYTVNFMACDVAQGSQSALVQDAITLPASVSVNPDGWTFVGWVEAKVAETESEPAFYAPGASYTVTGNATLYALYTRVEGSTETVYELVADNLSDWTGNFVITSGKDTSLIALKTTYSDQRIENTTSGASVAFASTGMTLDGNLLKNVPADYVFEIAKNGSYYTIKNNTSGFWIGTQSTYLHNMGSYQANYADWNIEYDLYNICMKVSNVGSTRYTYLVVGNNKYFVVNTGYTTNKTQFWKETTESTTFYATDPVVQTHEHEMTFVPAVAPTCVAAGNSAYYYCAGCGKYFSDAEGSNEITLESTVIPATGIHTWSGWTSNNDGTHSHTCTVCGEAEAVACTYNDVVTAPTATEQGYTTHTCTVCGYSFVDSYTDPLGLPTYTVTFTVPAGVAAVASQQAEEGAAITLPAAGAPEGYTFVGWVVEEVNNASELPANVLTGSYTVTADITLKALYSFLMAGTSETVYERITDAPADWTGNYVITFGTSADNMYVLKGLSGNTRYESTSAGGTILLSNTGMTLADNKLTGATDPYIFQVASTGAKYSIRSASTGTYLGSYSSYLNSRTSYSSTYCQWALSVSNGNALATNSASSRYPYLTLSGSKYFMIGSSAPASLSFWKETVDEATGYTTVISSDTPQPTSCTVTFTVPSGVAAVPAQTVDASTVITLPAAAAPAGYTFVGWVTEDVDNSTAAPAGIFTGSYTVTCDVTLKALYSYTQTGVTGYQLLTSTPADWAGSYVITYGKNDSLYALKGLSGNTRYESVSAGGSVAYASTGMTRSGELLTNVPDEYVFQVASFNGKYSIRSVSAGTYLSSYSSYLYSRSVLSSSYGCWSFAMNGGAVNATNSYSSRYPYLSFSSSSYFMLGSSANASIYFWKLTEGSTSTVYTTDIG